MEGSPREGSDWSATPVSDRWRRPSSPRKLLALVLVALVLALSLLAFFGPDLRPLPLSSGSQLDYSMTGSFNNTSVNKPMTGALNVSIDLFTKKDYSFGAIGTYSYGVNRTLDIDSPPPFFWKVDPPGDLVGYDRIHTIFGDKKVAIWMSFDWGRFVFYDVGVESSVVYRMVVSDPEYHYCYVLERANNTNLDGYDEKGGSSEFHSLNHPSEEPSGFTVGSENGSEMYLGYSYCLGSLEIANGDRIRYEILGNMSSAFIFDLDSIKMMHETGTYRYNSTLSRETGNPGETNVQVGPGTYWFLFEFRSNGRVTFYWL
jgi:hypothetical protein